jgi:poly(3-hydroxybutyrate) depolymerase
LPPGPEAAQFAQAFREHGGAPDDVAFLKALVADLVRRGIADPKHVYLAGYSAGGVMTLRMVCTGEPSFAAIALIASSMPEATGAICRPAKPLPLLMIVGTADTVMPYHGSAVSAPDPRTRYRVWSAERVAAYFRKHNGCGEPVEKSVLPGPNPFTVEVERSTGCAGGRVDFYRIVGGGHNTLPQTPSAAQLFVDFFRKNPPAVAAATPARLAPPATSSPATAAAPPPAPSHPHPTPALNSDYEEGFERALAQFRKAPPTASGDGPPPPASQPAPALTSDYEDSFERALTGFRRSPPPVPSPVPSAPRP